MALYDGRYSAAVGDYSLRKSPAARTILQLLQPQQHEKILEIGCNDGWMIEVVRKHAPRTVGVDINPEAVSRSRVAGLAAMPAEKLDFPSGSFDKVFSAHTIEHTPNPARALAEIERVLVRGGVCVLLYPFEVVRGMTTVRAAIKTHGNPLMARKLHLHKLSPAKIEKMTAMKVLKSGIYFDPWINFYTVLSKL